VKQQKATEVPQGEFVDKIVEEPVHKQVQGVTGTEAVEEIGAKIIDLPVIKQMPAQFIEWFQ
jgi:hypothetical protein